MLAPTWHQLRPTLPGSPEFGQIWSVRMKILQSLTSARQTWPRHICQFGTKFAWARAMLGQSWADSGQSDSDSPFNFQQIGLSLGYFGPSSSCRVLSSMERPAELCLEERFVGTRYPQAGRVPCLGCALRECPPPHSGTWVGRICFGWDFVIPMLHGGIRQNMRQMVGRAQPRRRLSRAQGSGDVQRQAVKDMTRALAAAGGDMKTVERSNNDVSLTTRPRCTAPSWLGNGPTPGHDMFRAIGIVPSIAPAHTRARITIMTPGGDGRHRAA